MLIAVGCNFSLCSAANHYPYTTGSGTFFDPWVTHASPSVRYYYGMDWEPTETGFERDGIECITRHSLFRLKDFVEVKSPANEVISVNGCLSFTKELTRTGVLLESPYSVDFTMATSNIETSVDAVPASESPTGVYIPATTASWLETGMIDFETTFWDFPTKTWSRHAGLVVFKDNRDFIPPNSFARKEIEFVVTYWDPDTPSPGSHYPNEIEGFSGALRFVIRNPSLAQGAWEYGQGDLNDDCTVMAEVNGVINDPEYPAHELFQPWWSE